MEETPKFSIREWSQDDRPREKLVKKGVNALSDSELLAIILGSGSKKESAVDLAKRILSSVDNHLGELTKMSVEDMCRNYKGVGMAKAVSMIAAFELGKRRRHTETYQRPLLNNSKKIYEQVYSIFADLKHEECWALYLNTSNLMLDIKQISKGGVNETTVDPRIVLKHAVQLLAASIVLCHNHPSGNPMPSGIDNTLTNKLKESAKMMGVVLLDHLVVCDGSYYSYADHGLL